MKKRIFYIISISASLVILVFSNGDILLVFAEANRSESGLILKGGSDFNLGSINKFSSESYGREPAGIINSFHFASIIILLLLVILGTNELIKELSIGAITIRGPPLMS